MSIRTHIIKSTMLLSSLFIIGQVAEAITVDVGGSIRPRLEFVDEGGQGQGLNQSKNHTTMQSRINVKATVDESVSAFIQIQDVRTWGGEPGSANGVNGPLGAGAPPSITRTGTTTDGQVDFHQAYILVKNVMGSGASLKVGRQEMVFDEARLIGNIGWIQQAQSFDAVRVDGGNDSFGVTGFYAKPIHLIPIQHWVAHVLVALAALPQLSPTSSACEALSNWAGKIALQCITMVPTIQMPFQVLLVA